MHDRKINVLGTEYQILFKDTSEDDELADSDGYMEAFSKKIVVRKDNPNGIDDFEQSQKNVLRHEVFHAFLQESGLAQNAQRSIGSWARNEEMVDWFAIQSPKIYKVFAELDIL